MRKKGQHIPNSIQLASHRLTVTFQLNVEFFMWKCGLSTLCSILNFLGEMEIHNMWVPDFTNLSILQHQSVTLSGLMPIVGFVT